ncbi:MAG: RNA-binding S4 domain-containing protein [Syntrophaceticus sp.]
MRLDKFLQISRLIKRRTSAKEACLAGRVQVNGKVAKPGSEVKVGDRIDLAWGKRLTRVELLQIPERNIPAAQAKTLYTVLDESVL